MLADVAAAPRVASQGSDKGSLGGHEAVRVGVPERWGLVSLWFLLGKGHMQTGCPQGAAARSQRDHILGTPGKTLFP